MREEHVIEIQLVGANLSPAMINSRHIATLITSVEKMLAAVVARDNPELGLDESHITIGVSAVHHGSYRVQFESQYRDVVQAAYQIVTTAIDTHEFDRIPENSIEAIKQLRSVAREYQTDLLLGYQNGQFVQLATLNAATPIDVASPEEIEGETVLYGVLTSIGGVSPPKATLQSIDGQRLVCNVTEKNGLAIAKRLGARLYSEIGVRGLARWNMVDMSITFFRIDELLDYASISLPEAIDNSHSLFGHYLEALSNQEEFFREIRYGNEGAE